MVLPWLSLCRFLRCRSWRGQSGSQWQIIEKIVAFPEIQTIQGTQTFESLETAHVRLVATVQTVEVVEVQPPLFAESAPPTFVTAPVVEAAPIVVEYVQPAHVVEYVTPEPAVSITDNFTDGEFAQALVLLSSAISQFFGHLKSMNDRVSSLERTLEVHAASLTPRFSTNVQNMKDDSWRTTLPPPPTRYSASATRLWKSKVSCPRLYVSLTTAIEDACQSDLCMSLNDWPSVKRCTEAQTLTSICQGGCRRVP